MKTKLVFTLLLGCFLAMPVSAQLKGIGKKVNVGKLADAGKDAVKAATLSDEDVAELCRDYMAWMDTHNKISAPDSKYSLRLDSMVKNVQPVNGMKLNFKVYEVIDQNAFASGDGSVRVFAGLMDIMSNEEVMAVIGHEVGHLQNTDTKDAMRNAYKISAVKNAASAVSKTAGKFANSDFGAIATALQKASFSQKQETEADIYSITQFLPENGVTPLAMPTSLKRLSGDTEGQPQKSGVSNFINGALSSHPEMQKRIANAQAIAEKTIAEKETATQE
jgi:putative metalloprotease